MSELSVSKDLALPRQFVTHRNALLGMSGSGKSNASVVIAEEMWKDGLPWIAIDPKGDWYGVRSSADGKRAGLDVPIFGGDHGDLPLAPLRVPSAVLCHVARADAAVPNRGRERRPGGRLIGRVVNARTLFGEYVQGRLIYQGRRNYGPRPNQRVAILVGIHARRGQTFVCDPGTVRLPPAYGVTWSAGA